MTSPTTRTGWCAGCLAAAGLLLAACGGDKQRVSSVTITVADHVGWVAFQDGAAPWALIQPDQAGGLVYTRKVTDASGRFGVAGVHIESGIRRDVTVIQGTVAEATAMQVGWDAETPVIVQASNFPASAWVFLSGSDARLDSAPGTVVPLCDDGNRDLVVMQVALPTWPSASNLPSKAVVRRGIAVGPTTPTQTVDLGSPNPAELVDLFAVHALLPSGPGTLSADASLVTANHTVVRLGDASQGWFAFGEGTAPGDFYSFQAVAGPPLVRTLRNTSTAADPGDQSFALGDIAPLAGTSMTLHQVGGLQYAPSASSPPLRVFSIEMVQEAAPSTDLHWQMMLTVAWLSGATDYARPDFTGLPGFNPAWELQPGIEVQGLVATFAATESVSTIATGRGPEYVPGLRVDQAMESHTFVP